jgi:phosphohistidine phosphatase
MILVLLRHGAAEKLQESFIDHDRKLIEKGVHRTSHIALCLKSILLSPVTLYSSPLIRAYETAEIISTTFGELPVHFSDELATGDYKTFLGTLDTEGTIIAVGHEPYLSALLFELTKVKIEFKMSSFAIVEINHENVNFITYAKYADIARTTKKTSYFQSLAQIRDIINNANYIEDPLSLHRYRVRLRHIDTLLYHLNHAKHTIYDEKLHLDVSIQLESSNSLREIDATIERLNSDLKISAALKKLIEKERKNQISIYKKSIEKTDFNQNLQYNSFILLNRFYKIKKRKALVCEMFEDLLKKTKDFIEKMDKQSIEDLHDLRLFIKKIVYTAEMESNIVYKKHDKLIDFSIELKDLLGGFLDYHHDQIWLHQVTSGLSNLEKEVSSLLEKLEPKSPSLLTLSHSIYRYSKMF